jgi:uncharacterized membrane protein (UPF0127 family)
MILKQLICRAAAAAFFVCIFSVDAAADINSSTVTVITVDSLVKISVDIAATPEDRAALDNKKKLSDNKGLLFIYQSEEVRPVRAHSDVFMDVLLIGKDGNVKDILSSVPPDTTPVSTKSYAAELKLTQQSANSLKIRRGYHVVIPGIDLKNRRWLKPDEPGLEKIEQILKNALIRNPDAPDALIAAGRFYIASGQPYKAVELLKNADVRTPGMLVTLAIAYNNTGQNTLADKALMAAIDKNRTFIAAYEQLILFSRKTLQAADKAHIVYKLLQNAIDRNPEFQSGRLLLFRLQLSANNLEEAQKNLLAAPDKTPEIERAFGDLFLREGNFSAAAQKYTVFIKARPYHRDVKDLQIFVSMHYLKNKAAQ